MNQTQKILIVDDKKENLVALRQVLHGVEAEIIEAANGNEALAATLDHDFAMAILDVMMPEMNGFELAENLRGDAKTRLIPIVFVTAASPDEQHMFTGYEAGGVDYLVKPYAPEILLAKVRIFLEMDRQRRELQRHRDQLETLVAERTRELARELAERKQAEMALAESEAQFRQAQKMESVGRLAGGVAHDFNNMLSIIIGYGELVMAKLDAKDQIYRDIGEIVRAAKRSADLTRQLLAFSRQQTILPRVVNLNELVKNSQKMLKRLVGEDIELRFAPKDDLWVVKIDPSQVDQILANLTVNARDAIAGVGMIAIETDNVDLDESYCAFHPGLVPGEYVVLVFSDSGSGMAKETMQKIFEPFFTTKEEGKGTGLGLSTVYGIVKQNHGFINVYSEPGHGASFRIYFPRHLGPAAKQEEKPVESVQGGGETLLLVEDELPILDMCKRILEKQGYSILTARLPGEAVALCEQYKDKISLLISDVIMPSMNGLELQERISRINPAIKTLFMSGYTADKISREGALVEKINFIQKPFTNHDFLLKIRQVLNQE